MRRRRLVAPRRDCEAMSGAPEYATALQDAHTRARSDVLAAERTLHELAQTYSSEALFAAAFIYLVVVPADRAPGANRGTAPAKLERLAFHLWPYRDRGGHVATPEAVDMA